MSERHRWYFRKQATLNGAPNVPTGCFTMSRDVPTMTDANGGGGGHNSTSSGAAASQLNKPQAQDNTTVAGEAPQTSPPAAAHQFGWFSDLSLTGHYEIGSWDLILREDDNNAGITSHWTLNVFANKTRDFASTMRFVADLHGSVDNWTGATTVQTQTLTGEGAIYLEGEYLFFQLWCHETAAFSAGQTMTIHQEGSDLADSARSNLLSPIFVEHLPDYSRFPP
jgi:hypothetical protein